MRAIALPGHVRLLYDCVEGVYSKFTYCLSLTHTRTLLPHLYKERLLARMKKVWVEEICSSIKLLREDNGNRGLCIITAAMQQKWFPLIPSHLAAPILISSSTGTKRVSHLLDLW